MIEFFSKIFINNHNDTKNPTVRKDYGTMSSWVGIITNVILSAIKLIAGILASSVAIIADALNNLSDAGSSLVTLVGFKLSSKPADKEHPFGHARIEYITSMIVSFLILLVGAELLMDSGKNILDSIISHATTKSTDFSTVTIIILVISIGMKLWLGFFQNGIGKKIDSAAITATSADSLSDAISTTAILISSIIVKYTGWYLLDSIVGLAVSILIIIAGIKILNETKNALLGEAPLDDLVDQIKEIVKTFPEVLDTHDLLVHNYGPNRYIASFHAEVDGKEDIYYLHDVIDNLEKKIFNDLNILCTVHLDPLITDDETVNELKNFLLKVLESEGLNLSVHDFRTVIGETHTNLIFDVVMPFEYQMSESELKDKICKAVIKNRDNCFCVITVDKG